MNASLYLALDQASIQAEVLEKKNPFWGCVMGMSCSKMPYQQLMIQFSELISEGEYEAACEEAAIDLGAHESDLDPGVEKELEVQSIREHAKRHAALEQYENRLDRGRIRDYWNPKSKKARNEKGVRILKQRAQADKHRR